MEYPGSRLYFLSCILLFGLLLAGCDNGGSTGRSDLPVRIVLNGVVDPSAIPAAERHGPIFVVVSRSDDMEAIQNGSTADVIDIVPVDADNRYSIDLIRSGLVPGETVYIIGFIDNDFSDSPALDSGDFIGFYRNPDSLTTAYILKSGLNDNLDIAITREVFNFESQIGGTVYCDAPDLDCAGRHDLTIVAYVGTITSSEFSDLDTDGIIAYRTYTSASFPLDYTLDIMPFGYDVPIENVHLIAFWDINDDGETNSGDIMGSHANASDDMPRCITIMEGMTAESDIFPIYMMASVAEAGQTDISVSGNVILPVGGENSADTPVVVMVGDPAIIADGDNIFAGAEYFAIISPGAYNFELDLSSTGLTVGDEVMVLALWDLDYNGCLPELSPQDMVGFYMNTQLQSFVVTLIEGGNTDIDIHVNREVYDFEATIGGTVSCPDLACEDGHDLTMVAYVGPVISSDYSDLDPDRIVGFKTYTSAAFPLEYTLDIMPFGYDVPIENVHIMAFCDIDDDGFIDGGDIIGSYANAADDMPRCVTVTDGMTAGADVFPVYMMGSIGEAGQADISVSGDVFLPVGGENSADTPVVVAVVDPEIMTGGGDNMLAGAEYFAAIPPGDYDFELDLSATGLAVGDEVMVIALWDLDYNGCLPELTPQDMVGFYADLPTQSFVVTLAEGGNTDVDIYINRETYDFEATIGGTVSCPDLACEDGHDLTIMAYAEPIISSDLAGLDLNGIIGYRTYTDVSLPFDYTLNIMPFGYDVPIENVHLIAFLDTDDSGTSSPGDITGFYALTPDGMPAPVEITDGMSPATDIFNIYMQTTVPSPSGDIITLSGSIDGPAGYDEESPPIFIAIIDEQTGADRYFEMLDPGETTFDFDLSATGLAAGDTVMVLALWDLDFNGFPVITPVSDYIGIYVEDSNVMQTFIELGEGENTVDPTAPGRFELDRWYYDHNSSVSFEINSQGHCSGTSYIFCAITDEGVDLDNITFDFDYAVGFEAGIARQPEDIDYYYNLAFTNIIKVHDNVFPNPDNAQEPFSMESIYLLIVDDVNENGQPDSGEQIGYYSYVFFSSHWPITFDVENDGEVILPSPDYPTVRFWGETIP